MDLLKYINNTAASLVILANGALAEQSPETSESLAGAINRHGLSSIQGTLGGASSLNNSLGSVSGVLDDSSITTDGFFQQESEHLKSDELVGNTYEDALNVLSPIARGIFNEMARTSLEEPCSIQAEAEILLRGLESGEIVYGGLFEELSLPQMMNEDGTPYSIQHFTGAHYYALIEKFGPDVIERLESILPEDGMLGLKMNLTFNLMNNIMHEGLLGKEPDPRFPQLPKTKLCTLS